MGDQNDNVPEQEQSESSSGRKKIRIRKRIKFKKKKKKFRPKKLMETLLWIVVIGIFIVSFYLLMKQLDIGDDNNKKKKKSSYRIAQVAPDSAISV